MRVHPILFSGPMVLALLDGRKTQTRRIVKPQPYSNGFHFDGRDIACHDDYLPPSAMLMDVGAGRNRCTTSNLEGWESACPYGQPGDLLWVRETWADHPYSLPTDPESVVVYRATDAGPPANLRWRPSIHMPRWASRLTLRLTDVRVERVQDISEDDARAEGVTGNAGGPWGCEGLIEDFSDLWDSLNASRGYGWDENPWVWVLSFDVRHTNVDVLREAQEE